MNFENLNVVQYNIIYREKKVKNNEQNKSYCTCQINQKHPVYVCKYIRIPVFRLPTK